VKHLISSLYKEEKTLSEEIKKNIEIMARALAMYHVIFANEAMDMLGEEKGTELVKKVVARFGRERGKKIRERTDAKGEVPTLAAMGANYDLPLFAAWESVKFSDGSDITYCPMHEEWKKMNMIKEGKLYCAVDAAIAEGYSDILVFSRECSLMDGDNCCRHRYKSKNMGDN
jgi:predicted ArsR family transcriptional regulator